MIHNFLENRRLHRLLRYSSYSRRTQGGYFLNEVNIFRFKGGSFLRVFSNSGSVDFLGILSHF